MLFNSFSVHEIRNSVIRGNTQWQSVGNANHGGGGLQHMYSTQLYLWNCLIADNQANGSGSGIYNMKGYASPDGDSLVLRNCTVAGNSGPSAAVQTRTLTDHLVMYNSILYGNTARDLFLAGSSTSYLHYSCFPTNPSPGTYVVLGAGNLTSDPGFVDVAGGNYRLGRNSPCLNAGTNQPDWMAGALDLDGNPRIDNLYRTVDMGCYETIYRGLMITIR